jgi:hypothetical protein
VGDGGFELPKIIKPTTLPVVPFVHSGNLPLLKSELLPDLFYKDRYNSTIYQIFLK